MGGLSEVREESYYPFMVNMSKSYLLFAGHSYYAAPGWDTFRGVCQSIDEARACILAGKIIKRNTDGIGYDDIEWYQIVDLETLTVVERGGHAYEEDETCAAPRVPFDGYRLVESFVKKDY